MYYSVKQIFINISLGPEHEKPYQNDRGIIEMRRICAAELLLLSEIRRKNSPFTIHH